MARLILYNTVGTGDTILINFLLYRQFYVFTADMVLTLHYRQNIIISEIEVIS